MARGDDRSLKEELPLGEYAVLTAIGADGCTFDQLRARVLKGPSARRDLHKLVATLIALSARRLVKASPGDPLLELTPEGKEILDAEG